MLFIIMPVNISEDSQLPSYNTLQFLGSDKIPFIFLLIIIILAYVFLFAFLNNSSINNESNKWWILVLEIVLIIILILVIALNLDNIKKNEYNFSTEIKNLFNNRPTEITVVANDDNVKISKKKEECKQEKEEGEVFHIYNNKYSYEQARDVCSTLDARLATYDEVEEAYNKGGGWCSYGWSEDQLALFPTQKDVYNRLKTIPKHRNDCGRPGINGGYIENKKFKFGVNCYGKKPYNKSSEDFMNNYSFIPALANDKFNDISNGKVKEDTIMNMLIAPFNKKEWNEPE